MRNLQYSVTLTQIEVDFVQRTAEQRQLTFSKAIAYFIRKAMDDSLEATAPSNRVPLPELPEHMRNAQPIHRAPAPMPPPPEPAPTQRAPDPTPEPSLPWGTVRNYEP